MTSAWCHFLPIRNAYVAWRQHDISFSPFSKFSSMCARVQNNFCGTNVKVNMQIFFSAWKRFHVTWRKNDFTPRNIAQRYIENYWKVLPFIAISSMKQYFLDISLLIHVIFPCLWSFITSLDLVWGPIVWFFALRL